MKKLTLRSEYLTELTADQMSRLVGAGPEDRRTISDGSCVCSLQLQGFVPCDISDGSCVCGCDDQTHG